MLRSFWLIALAVTFILGLGLGGSPAVAESNAGAVARAPLSERLSPQAQTNTKLYLTSLQRNSDASYKSPFGVSIYDTINDARGLSSMDTAGADMIFTNVKWYDVEYTQGVYDFSTIDAKAAAAASAGMELVVLFDNNPDWASLNIANPRGPLKGDMYDDLDRVIQALATRFNGNNGHPAINYWLFYGEPDNIYSGWGSNANDYGDMLARVSPLIRAANSQAWVMPGAVAYERFTDDTVNAPGPFARNFLPTVLARLNTKPGGAAAYINAVGFNEFGLSPARWPTLKEKAAAIRQLMTTAGVGSLPIIVTELSRTSKGTNTETYQAQMVIQLYAQGIAVNIAQLHWFQVFDMVGLQPPGDVLNAYGLFRDENINSPKPSYTAFAVVAREFDGFRYLRNLGVSGTEGYVFFRGSDQLSVVWGTSSAAVNVDFAQTCARRITRLDQVTQITDGAAGDLDGAANGRVRLQVTQNEPIIVRACQ